MFNDRDLGVLGAGAVLAIMCLLLPVPFAVRAVLGTVILIGFMAAALLRVGPDRVTVEEWIRRRIRYRNSARRFSNQPTPGAVDTDAEMQQEIAASPIAPAVSGNNVMPSDSAMQQGVFQPLQVTAQDDFGSNAPIPAVQPAVPEPARVSAQQTSTSPSNVPAFSIDFEGVGILRITTILMAVVGMYFVVWLIQGGGEELAFMFEQLLPGGIP